MFFTVYNIACDKVWAMATCMPNHKPLLYTKRNFVKHSSFQYKTCSYVTRTHLAVKQWSWHVHLIESKPFNGCSWQPFCLTLFSYTIQIGHTCQVKVNRSKYDKIMAIYLVRCTSMAARRKKLHFRMISTPLGIWWWHHSMVNNNI